MGNWYNDDSPSYFSPPPLGPARRVRALASTRRATHCVGCGTPLEPGYRGCPRCGRAIADVRRPGDATQETCGRCHTRLSPEFVFCPGGEEKLVPGESVGTVCACGTAVEREHHHCGGCGKPRAT